MVSQRISFVHTYEQASHGGELVHAVEAGLLRESDVTSIGAVLAGDAPGRAHVDDITTFDSTGLALQDLAVAIVALGLYLPLPDLANGLAGCCTSRVWRDVRFRRRGGGDRRDGAA